MKHCKIIPIRYGESVLAEDQIFEDGAKDQYRPIVFLIYLIRTDEKLILVDAGCETMPGFDMKQFVGPVKALQKAGVSPEDITDLIITHAHHDHIECTKYFVHAKIYIQKEEYEVGKRYIPANAQVMTFDQEYEVCDSVKIIKIGGHSIGSCIVQIDDRTPVVILAGDECYQYACLEGNIPTGCSCNRQKSRAFIEKYSKKEYTVLLCHELSEQFTFEVKDKK